MSEIITNAISDRICKHMNEDHTDALVLYAKHYGNVSEVKNATMLSIDNQGMYLSLDGNNEQPLRITFDHDLKDAQDAHHTLVDMLKVVRKTT